MNKSRVWNGVAIYAVTILLGIVSGFAACGLLLGQAIEPISFAVAGLLIILLSYNWALVYQKAKSPLIGALLLGGFSVIAALTYMISALIFYNLGANIYSEIHDGASLLCGLSPIGRTIYVFGALVIIQAIAFMVADRKTKKAKKTSTEGKSA